MKNRILKISSFNRKINTGQSLVCVSIFFYLAFGHITEGLSRVHGSLVCGKYSNIKYSNHKTFVNLPAADFLQPGRCLCLLTWVSLSRYFGLISLTYICVEEKMSLLHNKRIIIIWGKKQLPTELESCLQNWKAAS